MRGGTENVPGIAGLSKAVEILESSMSDDIEHYKRINASVRNELNAAFGGDVIYNSDEKNSLPNILNVTFNPDRLKVPIGLLPVKLDLSGISVSGGSACSSGSLKPSRVLLETGMDERLALSSIRISVGRFNIDEDVKKLIEALKNILSA